MRQHSSDSGMYIYIIATVLSTHCVQVYLGLMCSSLHIHGSMAESVLHAAFGLHT